MNVINKIDVLEIDGDDVPLGKPKPKIIIKNHRSRKTLIIVEVLGTRYTISADMLLRSIENATNFKN